MLSTIHSQAYQEFISILIKIQQETKSISLDTSILAQDFGQLQQIWQTKLLTISTDDLNPAFASRWQSLQTEINRAFRLLATEILFVSVAKEEKTRLPRLITCHHRLDTIIGYCHAMLREFSDE